MNENLNNNGIMPEQDPAGSTTPKQDTDSGLTQGQNPDSSLMPEQNPDSSLTPEQNPAGNTIPEQRPDGSPIPEQNPDSSLAQGQKPAGSPMPRPAKTKFWKGFFIGLLVMLLLVGGIICILSWAFLNGKFNPVSGNTPTVEQATPASAQNPKNLNYDKITAKMKTLQKIISDNYLFDEDTQKVEDGIYAGMLNGLGDPYTVYYTEKEYNDLNESTSGTYSGIGAMLQQDPNTGLSTIVKVFDGSPAETAGLKAGDILYKVGDMEVTSEKLDIIVSTYIKGQAGTSVQITVLRGDQREEMTFTVTRAKIDVPTVSSKMLEDKTGYIEVLQFDSVTADQFKKAVDDLTAQGMEKLVIDLRDNPGGLVDSCVNMLDYMLPDGLLVYTANRNGVGDKYYSKDGHEVNIPTAILVNGNSASASEIFSGAYKDFKRAKLVGTKTFGKGIVQIVLPLGDGTAVKITTQHYFTPSGYDLNKKGIEPDVNVELNKDAVYGTDSDNQLQAAIEALK